MKLIMVDPRDIQTVASMATLVLANMPAPMRQTTRLKRLSNEQ